MKPISRTMLSLLLALCLLACSFAIAEEPEAMPVEDAVEEVTLDLTAGEDDLLNEIAIAAPENEGDDAVTEQGAEDVAPEPVAEPEPEVPAYFGNALKPKTIRLKKDATSGHFKLGLPYKIALDNDKIKRVSVSDKKLVTVSADGTIELHKTGEADITVRTKGGKKHKLHLTIQAAPAPTSFRVRTTSHHMKLKWAAAERATGYLVEYSEDGENWIEYKATAADARILAVTKVVKGPTSFRVTAILGDHLGGTSEVIRVLDAVTDAKVFMEESLAYGPTERMNVTWTASPGASGYEVYRAALPSKNYKLVGTTKETWYADTLAPTKLYSYKIRPVWNGVEDLPLCKAVNLWSGMQSNVLPPSEMTSSTGIILVVNKRAQVTTAYIQDAKGRYRLPLRHMICSTGLTYERTRNGEYTILRKNGEWYTYPGPSGDTIRWPSVYRSGYYFHSPLYNKNHTIRLSTVNRLGDRASAGCVRLKSNDAEWVYRNCPVGTTVFICDGDKKDDLKAALKPKTVEVKGF